MSNRTLQGAAGGAPPLPDPPPLRLSTRQFHRDRESGGKEAANPLLGGKEETCPALRAVWRTRFLFVPRSGGVGSGTPVGLGKPTPAFGHPSQEGMGRTPALASVKLSCREPSEGEGKSAPSPLEGEGWGEGE